MKHTNLEFVYRKISFPWFSFITFTVNDDSYDAGAGCIPLFCALFIDFVIGVWKEKEKPFCRGLLQVTMLVECRSLRTKFFNSLLLCYCPMLLLQSNLFCVSQFLALLLFHYSFPLIGTYTFIRFSFNNFLNFCVFYNTTSCFTNFIKHSSLMKDVISNTCVGSTGYLF